MEILKHTHSGLRWLFLVIIIIAIINAIRKWKSGASFEAKDKLLNIITIALTHTTGIIGLILFTLIFYYFLREKIPVFFLFKENKEKYLYLSNLIMILIYLWPMITYGSFYTSLNGLYIWLNISFLNYLSQNFDKYK